MTLSLSQEHRGQVLMHNLMTLTVQKLLQGQITLHQQQQQLISMMTMQRVVVSAPHRAVDVLKIVIVQK